MKIIQNTTKKIRVEIEKISNRPFYYMNYSGNYCYDEYLLKGTCNLEEFCTFINENLIFNSEKKISKENFGCGAFVAQNTDGDIIFARNMDCEYAIPMMIRLSEDNDYKSLALASMADLDWDENTYETLETDAKLTLAAPYSPYDGINEHGLAVAFMTDASAIYPNRSNKVTLFDFTLLRLLLNKAKSVDEAIKYMKNYNLFYDVAPLHYMVADATGDAAVIEFVDGKMVTIRKNNNYQVVTNFTLYNNPTHNGFGKDRYENIESELEKRQGIITDKDALELLKKNVIPGDEQWSAVYNLTKRRVMVTFSREYNLVYCYEL
ncbi:linear amide C-N hydrolase [Anaerocolumna sedimenticola]|uniref:Linear amide C-N hydrolase n=1 Tax=Anaerocolumna sedimenticola TaxID=2696063 RepID=A0A6P1THR1_9FIRM|nr:linear amide C-N hydrolase [Anaerocolumna sedimenticola]QHQ59571.1 linear amide C-N hydrolase [Anaerocolumna sedimenticola]